MKSLLHIILSLALSASVHGAEWQTIQVPGKLKLNGTGWLRIWVKVDDGFFSRHERNLFEESVGVNIRELAGAHEVWVNGKKVGTGGAFPPSYHSAGNTLFRHKVPVGTLHKGKWNEIALRVHNPSGPGGFAGDAPFIMNYFLECVFAGDWEFLAADNYKPGTALTNKPVRATFEAFRESQRVLGRTEQVHGPSLSPNDAAAKLQAFDDLKVDLLLHEPLVAQPFHFSFDARGRLWVAQARQYPYPAGLTMLSRDKVYRAHYDKVPAAPPNHDRGADIISIHEDTNGDGVFDKHKVFVDGLNLANAAVSGRGGVWVMNSPYLLFYPDANGDDIPDGPPEVRLAGFGFEDSHSTANGLVWGPDGWLYGGQGSTASCRVRRPGLDAPESPGVYFEGCMVWRYHPKTRAFEIFAEGSGNTFGLEVDAQGRLYSGHNGGTTRGWHYAQGGFYRMQGIDPGKFGPPRNPYAFGELPMMATTNVVVRFTHFGAFAEGSAMPSKLAGMLFSIDPLHSEIIASDRKARGATFDTLDHGVVVKSSDPAFRPVYIANAPDGSLYVADMYEFYIAHGQHYQNQIDPTTGRIYRIAGKDAKLETDLNLAAKTPEQLMGLLGHPNKWHRHTAARLLGDRNDPKAAAALREVIAKDTRLGALNALWALHQSKGLDDTTAIAALKHPYPPVRMWTARLLGDEYGINRNLGLAPARSEAQLLPTHVFEALVAQAKTETDAEVRSQFASTARRLATPQAFRLVAAVMAHDEDVNDPYIPLLCWWVFEALIPSATADVAGFFQTRPLWDEPMVTEHILPRLARRFAVDGKRQELLLVAQLLRFAPRRKDAAQVMKGFEEAYRGRTMTGLPDELIAAMAASGGASLSVRLRQGDAAGVKEALAIVSDPKAKLEDRLLYTRTFGEVRTDDAVPVLLKIAGGEKTAALSKAAFASLGAYDSDIIATSTVEALQRIPAEVRTAAFTLLASRAKWTQALMAALQSGTLSLSIVPTDLADQLRAHRDKSIRDAAARLFPKATVAGYDFKKKLAEVEAALKSGPGSPYAGEATFMQRCAACHKLFFKGGNIGPDLTSYQRDNLGTMLISIVNPNAEIREGFQFINVETTDGRSLSGFQVDRDNQVTVLRGLDGQDVTITANEIKQVQPVGRSLMPEGLIEGLTEQQLRDFFAYLRISQPISK